jgi:hypothetical protein
MREANFDDFEEASSFESSEEDKPLFAPQVTGSPEFQQAMREANFDDFEEVASSESSEVSNQEQVKESPSESSEVNTQESVKESSENDLNNEADFTSSGATPENLYNMAMESAMASEALGLKKDQESALNKKKEGLLKKMSSFVKGFRESLSETKNGFSETKKEVINKLKELFKDKEAKIPLKRKVENMPSEIIRTLEELRREIDELKQERLAAKKEQESTYEEDSESSSESDTESKEGFLKKFKSFLKGFREKLTGAKEGLSGAKKEAVGKLKEFFKRKEVKPSKTESRDVFEENKEAIYQLNRQAKALRKKMLSAERGGNKEAIEEVEGKYQQADYVYKKKMHEVATSLNMTPNELIQKMNEDRYPRVSKINKENLARIKAEMKKE